MVINAFELTLFYIFNPSQVRLRYHCQEYEIFYNKLDFGVNLPIKVWIRTLCLILSYYFYLLCSKISLGLKKQKTWEKIKINRLLPVF
jgi:hypothetical protein